MARLQSEVFLHERYFSRHERPHERCSEISPKILSLYFAGQKIPQNSCQISRKSSLPPPQQKTSPTSFCRRAGRMISGGTAASGSDQIIRARQAVLRTKAKLSSSDFHTSIGTSGHFQPRQGTEICNFGVPSPLEALQWIFCFFSSMYVQISKSKPLPEKRGILFLRSDLAL